MCVFFNVTISIKIFFPLENCICAMTHLLDSKGHLGTLAGGSVGRDVVQHTKRLWTSSLVGARIGSNQSILIFLSPFLSL